MEVLFWNINNNKNAVKLISETDFIGIDRVFGFAEYWDVDSHITSLFSNKNLWIDDVKKRVGYVCSDLNLKHKEADRYFTHFTVDYNGLVVHIWVVHLRAKLSSEEVASSINAQIIHQIADQINSKKFINSIIIGDFNLTHYDEKLRDFFHLNSTYYFNQDDPQKKVFDGKSRLKFYNPIAALSGDLSKGPPGTYYYSLPNQSQSWHSYDIALVSYNLSRYLDNSKCEILTELNGICLVNSNGRPNTDISDHLPIVLYFV